MTDSHLRQTQELGQETQRAMTLRERFERELDELERSLARMRATVRDLPDDPAPGPSVPIEQEEGQG